MLGRHGLIRCFSSRLKVRCAAEVGHVLSLHQAAILDTGAGFETEFHVAGQGSVDLMEHGEYHYDHIVLLASASKSECSEPAPRQLHLHRYRAVPVHSGE